MVLFSKDGHAKRISFFSSSVSRNAFDFGRMLHFVSLNSKSCSNFILKTDFSNKYFVYSDGKLKLIFRKILWVRNLGFWGLFLTFTEKCAIMNTQGMKME